MSISDAVKVIDLGKSCQVASALTANEVLKAALLEASERLKGQRVKIAHITPFSGGIKILGESGVPQAEPPKEEKP